MSVSARLELYQQQHAVLLRAARALEADTAGEWLPGSPESARGHLLHLSGKLTVHLQMEDRGLYPELQASSDPRVRDTATRFQASMGELRVVADAFFQRWLRPGAIAASPDDFRAGTRAILAALGQRIAAEDAALYPLVDSLD